MEVDAIHSLIERRMKNKNAYIPADFLQFTEDARKKPTKLRATLLDHTFFKNYNKELYVESIRPGKKTNDPKVTDIKALKFESGKFFYKLSHNEKEKFKLMPGKVNKNFNSKEVFLPLIAKQLPLSEKKQKDIKSLKQSIPTQYHFYYASLIKNF